MCDHFPSDPAPLDLTSFCTHIFTEITGENQIEHNQQQLVEAGGQVPRFGASFLLLTAPIQSPASMPGSSGVIWLVSLAGSQSKSHCPRLGLLGLLSLELAGKSLTLLVP